MGDDFDILAASNDPELKRAVHEAQVRTIKCLNFCQGIPTAQLERVTLRGLVEAAQAVLDNGDFPTHDQQYAATGLALLLQRFQKDSGNG